MLEPVANVGFGGQGLNDRLPKILAEIQGLTISGPLVGATANTPITLAGIEYNDTIIKVLAMGVVTSPSDALSMTDVTSSTTIADRRAKGTVTLLSTLVDGDYVTVHGKRYTFKDIVLTPSTNLAPGIVPIAYKYDTSSPPVLVVDTDTTAKRLATAIMTNDATLSCTEASSVVTVTYQTAGTGGNAVALATSGAHATVSGANLAGGTATSSISINANTSGESLLVFWYNKA